MSGTTSTTDPAGGTPPRRSGRRYAVVGGGVATVALAGLLATTLGGSPAGPGDTGTPVDLGPVQRVALQSFSSCDALLTYYRGHARSLVGPYGLEGTMSFGMRTLDAAGAAESAASGGIVPGAAPAPQAAKAADGTTGATSEGGTNVQVAGVDEADVAKLSGDLLVTLSENRLNVLRTSGRTVTRLARLDLAPTETSKRGVPGLGFMPAQLLVHGTRAIVSGQLPEAIPAAAPSGGIAELMPEMQLRSRVAEIDLSDPAEPRLVRTLDVDGSIIGARLVDGVLRLALTNPPQGIAWTFPQPTRTGAVTGKAQQRATDANRTKVAAAGLDVWLPDYRLTSYDAAGRATPAGGGRLLECADVASPQRFAGLDTLSLVTADLDAGGLADLSTTAVVAQGATVYATPDHTYVSTGVWQAPTSSKIAAAGSETAVHLFETEGRTTSRYVASGRVQGHLLNQFAMDEHEGVLRVATTTDGAGGPIAVEDGAGDTAVQSSDGVTSDPAASSDAGASSGAGASSDVGNGSSSAARPVAPPAPRPSESRVTVLRQQGRALVQVGVVGGLGRTEQIRSVRFIGDLGYVVTFRQTDPLYTIDLSDPAKPRVAGELKILGYSAYLHPVGAGRLLGVGQDADGDGRTKGLQLSLFDVSDPAAPKRLDAVGVGEAWSDVEGDHHAFTFADGLALAPYSRWFQPDPSATYGTFDTGVLAVRLGGAGLQAPKTLRPLANGPVREGGTTPSDEAVKVQSTQPQRTFVKDGVVYTVTSTGIAAHDAATLTRIGFTPYGS